LFAFDSNLNTLFTKKLKFEKLETN